MTAASSVTNLAPVPVPPPRRSAFRLGAGRVPFERSVRCLAAMGGPMLVAVLYGEPVLGAVASVGTLAAPFIGQWTFRQRCWRLSVHALVLGTAYTLGAGTATVPALSVVVLATVATVALLVAGLAGAWATPFGIVAANVAILGSGLGATFASGGLTGSEPSAWEGGLLALAGALWVMVAHVVGLSPRRAEPESAAVVGSYRALAAYLSALGTSDTDAARIAARYSVLAAWDALGSEPPDPGRSPHRARLYVLQQDAQRLLDAAVAVSFRRPGPVPAVLADVVVALAVAVSDPRVAPAIAVPPVPPDATAALAHLYRLVERTRVDAADPDPEPAVSPTPLRETVRDRIEGMSAVRAVSVRTAGRVGIAVAVAHTIGLISGVDRGYWVTLTTLLVMQPDPANTEIRAVQRALGTILGVAILGPLLVLGPQPGTIALAMLVVGYLLPGGFARSYLSAATLLTLYALMLTDSAGGGVITWALLAERVLDTVVGCLVAVAAGWLLWPRSATRRLPRALADALHTEAELLRGRLAASEPTGATADAADAADAAQDATVIASVPARERRLLLLRLLNVRGLIDRAAGERPAAWPAMSALWPVVVLTLRTGVRLVTRPAPDDTQLILTVAGAVAVADVLDRLADDLVAGRVPAELPWTEEDPPSPMHAEVTLLGRAVAGAARRPFGTG